MTSLPPSTPYSPTELAQLYPSSLALQQVHIFLRHGERTPVKPRLAHLNHPSLWPYCRYARTIRAAISLPSPTSAPGSEPLTTDFQWQRKFHTLSTLDDSFQPYPTVAGAPREDLCAPGTLTDAGRASTHALGTHLRQLYVTSLGFLSPRLNHAGDLALRSTNVPRALESLQHAVAGLYPPSQRAPDLPPFSIAQAAPGAETLVPNSASCARLRQLFAAFSARAAQRWNASASAEKVHMQLERHLVGSADTRDFARIGIASRPSALGVLDTINASRAEGTGAATRLPREFYHPDVLTGLEAAGIEEWFSLYSESAEARRLASGPLLGDMVEALVRSAEGEPAAADIGGTDLHNNSQHVLGPQITLNGCHDTTLGALLSSLGAFDGRWPPFTSHIAIELFRAADQPAPKPWTQGSGWLAAAGLGGSAERIGRSPTSQLVGAQRKVLDGYFVRLRYNDRSVVVPGCKAPNKHFPGDESFCTLAAFKEIVDNITPRHWKTECESNLDQPPIPSKPEPAGY
ncbi:hypothetical protein Cpir12675_003926 [Ceratocystis pirilliformis]|uniref:Acid phosphatase n=1 Tax=Ceratocystis pirilliformis TaxID=259994 RepID=A0ABR3YZR2_9PEZI